LISREPPSIPEYRLRLDVDFDRASWTGLLEVPAIHPEGPFDLDCEGLTVTAAKRGSRPVPFELDLAHRRLHFPDTGEGPEPLRVEFSGAVQPKGLLGLYRCRHGDGTVLTTQCEPVGARRIFPCLDRPDRKSRVQLTVRTGREFEVISNMATPTPRDVGGLREWTFEATPPMASYLFYLAIGHFDRAEDRVGDITFRVLGPPGCAPDALYALDAATRIVPACAEYYSVPYPLTKLDLVAVSEHAFGAMENWGAISFREVRLLIGPDATSFQRRDVFETVAHEIAHQWFGDLVTMASWDDVWLNESFAAFLETRLSEQLEPTLDARTDSFLRVAGTMAAFEGDSLPSTHPVRAHVERPEEISQVFDEITYGKGAGVLGMTEAYLGAERFRAGVADYLHRFRFGNARTEDLWDSLGRISGEPVAEILGPWIDRPGHPVIRVRTGERELSLRQERFSFLGSSPEAPWRIPMRVEIDGTTSPLIFDTVERTVPTAPGATVLLNPDAVGFYRVRYDAPMYDRLFASLPSRSAEDRWAVVEDLGAFLLAGEIDWPLYERALSVLGRTNDRLVVSSFASTLLSLALLFPDVGMVQSAARTFFAERLEAVGVRAVPGEHPNHGVLRERMSFGRARVDLAFARDLSELFPEWTHLDPNLRLATAVARGRVEGSAGWAELSRALERRPSESESTQLEYGLAWTGDPDRVRATLHLVDTGGVVRSHLGAVLNQVAANPVGRPLLWAWLQDRLPMLAEQFRGSGALAILLDSTVPLLGLGRSEELRGYFRDHPLPEGSRGLTKGLERLEVYERLGVRLRALR
jgi:tricorn protease interacting factor F2/3